MKTRRERTALSAGHSGRFVIQCSSSRAGDAPPVRHEDQKVRVRLDEFAPIKPRRVLIVFTQNVLSSCDLDQFGHPVSSSHRWLDPFDTHDTWPLMD